MAQSQDKAFTHFSEFRAALKQELLDEIKLQICNDAKRYEDRIERIEKTLSDPTQVEMRDRHVDAVKRIMSIQTSVKKLEIDVKKLKDAALDDRLSHQEGLQEQRKEDVENRVRLSYRDLEEQLGDQNTNANSQAQCIMQVQSELKDARKQIG